jgi:hypothetical protein
MEVKAKMILRSAFYAISRRLATILFTLSMTLIPILERLFFRDLIRFRDLIWRAERAGRKIEAIGDKIHVKLEKKNHAR